MPDREKVLKGIECCLGSNDCDVEPKEDCPYKGMCLCAMTLHFEVLALLKEHDAVGPKWASGIKGADALCGSCMAWISDHSWGYCPRCGRAVKWDA